MLINLTPDNGTFGICVCLNQLGEKEHFNLKVSNNDNISLYLTFAVLMKIKEASPSRFYVTLLRPEAGREGLA